jgi:peptidoglycan hydrolase-like protein with peptidoglycan-binding domain
VLCGERVTGYTLGALQRALQGRGYYKGAVDNRLSPATRKALEQFQRDAGLPVGHLDIETLQALGIQY